MISMWISLDEAASRSGVPENTLRRKCNAGEIPGEKRRKANGKLCWHIEEETIVKDSGDYNVFLKEWQDQQRSGYLTGKHIGERRIEGNLYGMDLFWGYVRGVRFIYKKRPYTIVDLEGKVLYEDADRRQYERLLKPKLTEITLNNLRLALSLVQIEHKEENCHFAIREHLHKAVVSFYKLLIQKGLRSEEDLLRIRALKPSRVYPEKRKFCRESDFKTLLVANESFLEGRTVWDQKLMRVALFIYYLGGLRLSEAFQLKLSDVDFEQGMLCVLGKGNKYREVTICPELETELRQFLQVRCRMVSKHPNFLLQRTGVPVTESSIRKRLVILESRSGVKMNPHAMRRGFITDLETEGLSWSEIMPESGHSSFRMIEIYCKGQRVKSRAIIRSRPVRFKN